MDIEEIRTKLLKKDENLRGGPPRKSAEEIEKRPKLLKNGENIDKNEGIPTKKNCLSMRKRPKKRIHVKENAT